LLPKRSCIELQRKFSVGRWDLSKSSFALGYARATENVTITNCYVTGDYQLGSMLDGTFKRFGPEFKVVPTGRIKCGTESNGGFKKITISNCVFESCRGFALETVDGALLEDVTFVGITMRDIRNSPLFLRLGTRMRGPEGVPVGTLKRIIMGNITSYGAVTLWEFRTEDKRSIRAALDFLLPYAIGAKQWDHQQIGGFHGDALLHVLERADAQYDDPRYSAAIEQLGKGRDDLETLLLRPSLVHPI
jgi:hypothetical protein